MGETYVMVVKAEDTLNVLKDRLNLEIGTPPGNQRLIYAGRRLMDDGRTLGQYGIQHESTIHFL